jgi:hypothetical protein
MMATMKSDRMRRQAVALTKLPDSPARTMALDAAVAAYIAQSQREDERAEGFWKLPVISHGIALHQWISGWAKRYPLIAWPIMTGAMAAEFAWVVQTIRNGR